MDHFNRLPLILVSVFILTITAGNAAKHRYGKGFFNHTGCLYAHLGGGNFEMQTADGDLIDERLSIDSLTYEGAKSKCSNENGESGKLVFSFKLDEKTKFKAVTIGMKIVPSLSEGFWEISQANLTISRADVDRKRTFQLLVEDMYASLVHSYSCSELVLRTLHKKKPDNETGRIEPRAIIILERFQLQPFQERENAVFAPSFDCSTWISVPGLMGLILILFITIVTVIGVDFLQKIETNEFKFNKEGQLFTQSQMESNKR